MRRFVFISSFVALCCALVTSASWAQEEEDEEPYLPGLIAEYQQAGHEPIRRLEAVIASRWTDRPDERLLPGKPATVTWRGVLLVPDDGPYQLHVHGHGGVQLELAGKPIVEQQEITGWASSAPQTLTYGPLPIRVTYTPTGPVGELSLFWSSDRFEREPIPARMLAHDRKKMVSTEFERGQVLARALRCEACHQDAKQNTSTPLPAPALDQLTGNVNRSWLINWLAMDRAHGLPAEGAESKVERRMPYLALPRAEAELIADWLLGQRASSQPEPPKAKPTKPSGNQAGLKKGDKKQPLTAAELSALGEQLLLTKGCLACHQKNDLGESGLFGGGDLTTIAAKRPRDFFEKWLQNPAALNRDHRMPVFELSAEERQALALHLSVSGKLPASDEKRETTAAQANQARELVRKHRCDQCHRLPEAEAVSKLTLPKPAATLSARSRWENSCGAMLARPAANQPQFGIGKAAASALQTYYSQRQPADHERPQAVTGAQLLIENNCLACHAREPQPAGVLPQKFADKLVAVARHQEDLAPQLPAMTPPSLNTVGDKLTDEALTKAITRAGPAHRPYLLVQMPRFRLSPEQATQLAAELIHTDRIPDYERTRPPEPTPQQLAARTLAGKRLVGTDGFSCTACHQVGSVLPVKAPLNARGPTLSLPQERLRKTWFDRWVRNPARIVPRMEMPSVQTPVRGVLSDNLPEQLAAVWQVLSTPGFEPPLPEPVRVARFYSSEDNSQQRPLVITDLIEHEGQTLERAALIGLPNRHNLLFDFATNRLLAWSQGDLARQRTKGKNWYWEPAGSVLLAPRLEQSELAMEVDGTRYEAATTGQWLVEPAKWMLSRQRFLVEYSLLLRKVGEVQGAETLTLRIEQAIEPRAVTGRHGMTRRFQIRGVPKGAKLYWKPYKRQAPAKVDFVGDPGNSRLQVSDAAYIGWEIKHGVYVADKEGLITFLPDESHPKELAEFAIHYETDVPADEYHAPRVPPIPLVPPPVTIAPGLTGQRLSLPLDIMPTAMAWRPNGDLVVASLKGQVLAFAADSLGQPQPAGELLADGLAAPYGIQAGPDYVDVATKYALLRVSRASANGATEFLSLASGWGYTSDYHDWSVGLPRDDAGNYYLALPCYQDNRVAAAKRLRGSVLKLTPRRPTMAEPGLFGIEVLTHGHRFPMGMALNKAGELFVTDNQGNYNPFNELNHVKPGSHFGFVNKGEKTPESHVAPAISIPHPWTRSVNGICFLNTPAKLAAKGVKSFGPLEGHMVGCEYDTRRLIRMSLQKVGDDYQGCCYPLTMPTPPEEAPLGPICCEVSPAGELFVGSIRDSGWGAGNNIGEVIRVTFAEQQLGHGLAEMRATASGFELDFFQPVEKSLAEDVANYSLSSYRRESTPAYGGNDIDRRTEKITAARLSADRKRVSLTLPQLRAGHVYELRLKSLASDAALFFPAEAHYTLRQLVR